MLKHDRRSFCACNRSDFYYHSRNMALNFEKFTRTGGSFSPTISIRKNGAFGFSQGALTRFGFVEGDWYVVLFYDKDAQVIGIKPTKEKADEGAVKLVKRVLEMGKGKTSVSSSVSAKAFFDYYGIPTNETKSFRAEMDKESGMITINLKQGGKSEDPPS